MKSKSMRGSDGGRKLASDHGRAKRKSGGEPQKGSERRHMQAERQTIIDNRRPKMVK